MGGLRIEPLQRSHAVEDFDCGEEGLNRFLSRFALANQRANGSRTYVALAHEVVIGFHSLVVGEVAPDLAPLAPDWLSKGLACQPVPLMVLARLAVGMNHQGRGIGAGLLKDPILRTLAAADIAGIRAMAVHAKNNTSHLFCEHFGFEASPTDPLHLYVLIKDLRGMQSGS